jgi:hypothetical protein
MAVDKLPAALCGLTDSRLMNTELRNPDKKFAVCNFAPN